MRKSTFILIIILMSTALIGIITVQVSWIESAIAMNEKHFDREVHTAMETVVKNIQNRELRDLHIRFRELTKNKKFATEAAISQIVFEQIDSTRNEKFSYARTILEQKYKVPTDFFNVDSLTIMRTFSKKDILVSKQHINSRDFNKLFSPEEHTEYYSELTSLDKENLKDLFYEKIKNTPVKDRISNYELNNKLEQQFKNRGITTDFKFAVYDNEMLTSVKSGYFKIKKGQSYFIPLFTKQDGSYQYKLYVNFPKKHKFLLSGIAKNLLLSILFIILIIAIFTTTLYQLNKQKQISAIKTDFINNMTHEFKTPIATINLALDAIKNPKVIGSQDKVLNYVKMIREENKRMHAQVETVLRISKLDKNQLDVSKEVIDIHEVLEDAISHIQLLIEDKKGKLNIELKAIQTEVLGNSFHITNIFVNILDNAMKYSVNKPVINISTENISNSILIHITDNGIGMSKAVQKHVFDKFYRAETGNIHNVKGHGLGLSYVKKIITLHQGSVSVASEQGKGSRFTVKLPVI